MINNNLLLKVRCSSYFFIHRKMSKKLRTKRNNTSVSSAANTQLSNTKGPIKFDKDRNILVEVYAKPGAKQNAITDISDEGINIQINAPPVEGSANTELVKYVASFLELKSSNVSLEKGHKSRHKVLKISGNIAVKDIIKKINSEVPDGSKLPEED